jgi:Restriction endonuclease
VADKKKWQHFERLVAAIHRAADNGADVQWNESIAGRQFDVTIRFKRGFYRYLTVVECKDYSIPVPVGDVEAFVTKAKDAGANYAVMGSSSGFQSGARAKAAKHGMTLILISFSEPDPSPFGARFGDEIECLHIRDIDLEYCDGEKVSVPSDAAAIQYYNKHILFQTGESVRTLQSVIDEFSTRLDRGEMDEYRVTIINCPEGTVVIEPAYDEVPLKPLRRIHVSAGLTRTKTLVKSHTQFDSSLLVPTVEVTDLMTGEARRFDPAEVGLGVNTVLEPGKFYENPWLGMFYQCASIRGNVAEFHLVESFQLGELVCATFTQETKYAFYYVPVTDRKIIARLEQRLLRYLSDRSGDLRITPRRPIAT